MSDEARVVLVTGATSGIGAAVTERLLSERQRVVAVGRNAEKLAMLESTQGVYALRADLAVSAERATVVRDAIALAGRLDAMVGCAGVIRYAPIGAIDEAVLREQLEVNLVAPFLLTQELAQHLRSRGAAGSIVHVASTLAQRPAADTAAYAATKAGLLGMCRSFAHELAQEGIRINAVVPGLVDTPMIHVERPGEPDPQKVVAALHELHPLGRLGTADEVAEAIVYLLHAPWITGAALEIDGGLLIA